MTNKQTLKNVNKKKKKKKIAAERKIKRFWCKWHIRKLTKMQE